MPPRTCFRPVPGRLEGVCDTPLHGYPHQQTNNSTRHSPQQTNNSPGLRPQHINIINPKNKMKTKAFTLILALAMLGLMAVINPAAAQDIRLSGSVAYVVKSDGNVYNGSNSQIGQFRGNTLYNRGGSSVGEIRGNSIYRGGSSVGEVRSGTVYNRSGQSIGEIKNGTIYNASHSSIGSYSNVDPTRVAALVFFKLLN